MLLGPLHTVWGASLLRCCLHSLSVKEASLDRESAHPGPGAWWASSLHVACSGTAGRHPGRVRGHALPPQLHHPGGARRPLRHPLHPELPLRRHHAPAGGPHRTRGLIRRASRRQQVIATLWLITRCLCACCEPRLVMQVRLWVAHDSLLPHTVSGTCRLRDARAVRRGKQSHGDAA